MPEQSKQVAIATNIFPGEVFANTADFDQGIRQLFPRYDEMLEGLIRCLQPTAQRVLELGCGTGEVSLRILQRCPEAHLVAMDYSPRMLHYAKAKLTAAGYGDRVTWVEADFGAWAMGEFSTEALPPSGSMPQFDACISSLAIHHLTDDMKQKLFSRIQESLRPGGYCWNADPVLPESPALAEVYRQVWEDWAAQQGTSLAAAHAGVGNSATQGYSNQDQLATLATHLHMLTVAGFSTVATPWKYYDKAIFGGRKDERKDEGLGLGD